jgi:imidazolonepropionase-like amidohydrolase
LYLVECLFARFSDAEQLSPEELKVVVQQAHMPNVKVALNAENVRTVTAALEVVVDSIEHGSELNEQAIELMSLVTSILMPRFLRVAILSASQKPPRCPAMSPPGLADLQQSITQLSPWR